MEYIKLFLALYALMGLFTFFHSDFENLDEFDDYIYPLVACFVFWPVLWYNAIRSTVYDKTMPRNTNIS